MRNKREIGAKYERFAGEYLREKGYEILEYNASARQGEIDIVARDGAYLVFAEVKYRTNLCCGHPLEAVNEKKQRSICKCALYYMQKNGLEHFPVRFDVVAITGEKVDIIQNAFDFIV